MPRGTRDWGRVGGGLQEVAELDTYIVFVREVTGQASSEYVLSIFNPSGSGKIANIHRVLIALKVNAGNHDNDSDFHLYTTTSLGTGSTYTPIKADPNSPSTGLQIIEDVTADPTTDQRVGSIPIQTYADFTPGEQLITPLTYALELLRHQPGSAEIPLRLREGRGIAIESVADDESHTAGYLVVYTEEDA